MNHYTNKKSLALLGHGKWKSALGHTLLLIGMVLVSMGAFAQAPTNGLYLNKKWEKDPSDPTGAKGVIRLETFVTGDKIITEEHIPTDIVLVLDVSGSMADNVYNYEYTARPSQAYSYNGYGDNTYYYLHTDGNYYAVERVRVNNSGGGRRYRRLRFTVNGTYWYLSGTGATQTAPTNVTNDDTTIWTGVLYTRTVVSSQSKMDALKTSVKLFVDIIAEDADDHDVDHRISIIKYAGNRYYNSNSNNDYPQNDANASNIAEGNHLYTSDSYTYNYTEVLINRRDPRDEDQVTSIKNRVDSLQQGGATSADFGMYKAQYILASIPAEEMETRNKVVVMFTDGEPTHGNSFNNTVANTTISVAHNLKHSWINPSNNNTYQFNATVFTVGVFGDDINANTPTYMDRTSSNYPEATSMTNTCVKEDDHYYFDAKSAEALEDIFEAIAGESGSAAMPMGVGTIVQDVISPSFQLNLPEGVLPQDANTIIKSYAPKCIGKEGDAFKFEGELDGAHRLTLDDNGVVSGGDENRLPDDIVNYDEDTKTLTFTNFNFEAMYVAEEKDAQGHPLGIYTGRKLVMLIPLEIGDGSWGDGINTNGPMSVIYPNGDMSNPIYFNNPTANVLGLVWTEVITTRPNGFPEVTGDGSNQTVDIDSPEDLAWFISEVNGRYGYNVKDGVNTNTVASHPKLNGRLTADIDMSRHNWVPIGSGWQVEIDPDSPEGLTRPKTENGQNVHMIYEGTFDGNGHVITGLKNNASKYYKQIEGTVGAVVVFPGMFSDVKGTIKNVFVLDADFRGKHHNANFVHHGIIADTLEVGGNIFNCEAAGRITCNNDDLANDQQLIFGGLVGLNKGTIHSCMAMAELTAYTMGGMIGQNEGSFSNGFTNGVYNYIDNGATGKHAGGIAAENAGTINNCYVRFERDNSNLDKMGAGFGMICGNNTGTVSNAYTPQIVTFSRPDYASATTAININTTVPTTAVAPGDNDENSYTLTISPSFYNMFTNDNSTGGTWGTLGSFNVYEQGTPLLTKLNNEAQNIDGAAAWKRTTAGRYTYNDLTGYTSGDINDDYPVLQFATFGEDAVTCLGSADGIRIDYATSLNEMLHRHNNGAMNENTQISNEFTASSADYYKVLGHAAINGGAINLYANDDVTLQTTGGKDGVADNCTAEGVVVYIDENTSLLQDATSTIEAYTGQTLKAFDNNTQQSGDRWHFISSSLEESQFGWSYLVGDAQIPYLDPGQTYTYNEYTCTSTDPCKWNLNNHDEDYAFYPIDLSSYARADFYCFYEPQYHWINFRRNSSSHWHMDNSEVQITYNNEDHFLPGKGYLTTVDMSQWWSFNLHGNTISKQEQFIQNRGTLNHENVEIEVTASAPAWTGLQGYNLLGNPYQSYLDFDEFVSGNAELMANSKFANTYGVYDPSQSNYIQYLSGSSVGANTASKYINMHQGFFIQVNNGGTAIFNNDMRTNDTDSQTGFRGAQPAFPLVNFTLTDANGNTDLAVLEVGRPENDGAKKLRMGSSTGRISLRHDNENCAILFRDMTEGSQPLYFDADEDGMFTLSWNTANADFRELTLVDNITGVRYDMLSHDSYVFEGHANDYKSRFKVVIGSFTDLEEEETVTNNFAFFDGSEWVVNGQGRLTVTDMMGRMVYSANLENDQNRVNLNGVAQGMYLMQVSNSDGSRVQKIVVR